MYIHPHTSSLLRPFLLYPSSSLHPLIFSHRCTAVGVSYGFRSLWTVQPPTPYSLSRLLARCSTPGCRSHTHRCAYALVVDSASSLRHHTLPLIRSRRTYVHSYGASYIVCTRSSGNTSFGSPPQAPAHPRVFRFLLSSFVRSRLSLFVRLRPSPSPSTSPPTSTSTIDIYFPTLSTIDTVSTPRPPSSSPFSCHVLPATYARRTRP